MRESSAFSVPKWPFFVGDAVLLGIAYFIYHESQRPLGHWEMAACGLCAGLGALLGLLPFLLEYRALGKALEATAVGTVAEKIQNLERLAAQISSATNHWENVQLQAEKISGTAREITERMTAEVRDFTDFMQKINDGEKATLRLEVEKLRRAENDWLQVLVHLLDHVYALHAGAARSGQPRLIEQLSHFQNACRDAARRVGVGAFAATPGEVFDANRHQAANGDAAAPAGAIVAENLAPGYTLQGRLIRPALVRVAAAEPAPPATAAAAPETSVPEPAAAEKDNTASAAPDQLPLESPGGA
jgi:molecular chaperone GrpE (heat shock protein)